jgi:DNA-binding response OmpR family regulator
MASNVLFLDDDEALLETVAEAISDFGHRKVLRARNLTEIEKLGDAIFSCGIAFLDINLGANQPNGIDVYHWLRAKKFPGHILFFTGHAKSHPLVMQACSLGEAQVISKPISLKSLLELLKEHP